MKYELPRTDASPTPTQLDELQWHRATNEGWRHPPDPPSPVPPARIAPRAALAVPGVVDRVTWRERRPGRSPPRIARGAP